MNIRNSEKKDVPAILSIYEHARSFMAEHGNPNQWGPNHWPPEALILQDIENGKSYVCEEEGQIVGTFFYDYGKNVEPTYLEIEDGEWIGGETYGVVHRIASAGTVKGTGSFCVNWAYEQCGHLRIDTHNDNYVMQNMLKKNGFVHCGTIYVHEDRDPRLAFEKL